MSTRSIIARPEGDGFAGVYAHWDGYPTCRGSQLWRTMRELGSAQAVRDYAIREGQPGYWSSYMPPDENAKNDAKPEFQTCTLCDGSGIRPDWAGTCGYEGCNGCGGEPRGKGTGLMSNRERHDGWVGTSTNWLTSYGDDGGTEWAYVVSDEALGIFVRRFGTPDNDQGYAMGMFGMGASDTETGGYWKLVGAYRWDGAEPDWEAVENAGSEEVSV